MADSQRLLLRSLVDSVYDMQATRIAAGNRLVAALRDAGIVEVSREGMNAEDEEKANQGILSDLLSEYELILQAYAEKFGSRGSIERVFKAGDITTVYIRTQLAYGLVDTFAYTYAAERKLLSLLQKEVKKHPMWDAFFKDVKGCGPLMAAVCIAYFDPYKARYVSSFYRYAGVDVIVDENGAHGRSRRDAVMVKYTNKNGEEVERRSLGYNPFVKAKLLGVLGTSFLRTGRDGKYAQCYYEYRNRLESNPKCVDLTPVVIHRRSIRYAVKMFLADMWTTWREVEGLPTALPYAVEKLGMAPHHASRNDKINSIALE